MRQRDATEGTFMFEFEGATGRFYNPMYELYAVPPDGATLIVTTTLACTYRGEPLFETTFRARYSGDGQPAPAAAGPCFEGWMA